MSAIMKSLCFSFLILASFATFFSVADAWRFNVGGNGAWVTNPQENYNTWAERNRFQVNDSLYFKYAKGSDSVQQVMKADFDGCNVRNPIKNFENGESVVTLDRSGAFYFISGNQDHCQKGQKLIVVVLAVRNQPSAPAHSPVPSVSPTQPPKSHSPVSPVAPASAPSKSQPPRSSVSPAQPPKSSSPISHTPALSPSHATSHSPATPSPSPKSPSPVSHSPSHSPAHTPSHSPAHAPSHSPAHAPSHSPAHAPSHSPAHSPSHSPATPKSPSPSSSPAQSPATPSPMTPQSPSPVSSPSPDQSAAPSDQSTPLAPSPSETTPTADNITAPAPSPRTNSASGLAVTSVMSTLFSATFTFLMFA
ncbi:early nodulin-like protein 1 [Arabidopsis thaliana]|uniref:Early nodulin-like protein 1 n=1 Tax=Arabidopsis thaliana TaxID=3702 RepID=A0A1P8BGZ7_ARATH|nr:early nodulin-like protein 1 [Arabidopsis thaliana]ANM70882.1 early nodulin-like protein 1 [Arabidopsis thaliana]|eukprot:NP_001332460.1 early nodulin-like protein 1 [Arabidopsis thaliana]